MNLRKWSPLRMSKSDEFREMEELHDRLLLPNPEVARPASTKIHRTAPGMTLSVPVKPESELSGYRPSI
jgi:hypothetical protein